MERIYDTDSRAVSIYDTLIVNQTYRLKAGVRLVLCHINHFVTCWHFSTAKKLLLAAGSAPLLKLHYLG